MSDTFTASNGFEVRIEELTSALVTTSRYGATLHVEALYADALREFFRDEEDKRLGRFRSGHFLVYPDPDYPGDVLVIDERTPDEPFRYARESVSFDGEEGAAARAYFDAHPERKPWQQPKTGEVWALSLDGDDPTAWSVNHDNVFMDAYSTLDPKSRMITAGRKIWPEES